MVQARKRCFIVMVYILLHYLRFLNNITLCISLDATKFTINNKMHYIHNGHTRMLKVKLEINLLMIKLY